MLPFKTPSTARNIWTYLKMLQYFNWLHDISVHIISWNVIPNMIQLRVKTCHDVKQLHLQKQMVVIHITCLLHLSCIKDAKNVSCSLQAFSAETSSNRKGFGAVGLMPRKCGRHQYFINISLIGHIKPECSPYWIPDSSLVRFLTS